VRRLLLAFSVLLLAACGSSAPPPKPVDPTLQSESDAGQLALEHERPEEAVARYQAALLRAQARDDLKAIGDLGYNLAVAQLEANLPDKALQTARATADELKRRGATAFPELILVEATALYRTGDLDDADAQAKNAAAGADPATSARATFLRGLIADDRGDATGLAADAAALKGATDPSLQADSAELDGRTELRGGDNTTARQSAEHAVLLRQQTLDYRGLARCLALGGEAARRAGDNEAAADLFFRAGRSAAAQGDRPSARVWLQQAVSLATDDSVRGSATALLNQLGS
jgi:hypothetical protein